MLNANQKYLVNYKTYWRCGFKMPMAIVLQYLPSGHRYNTVDLGEHCFLKHTLQTA